MYKCAYLCIFFNIFGAHTATCVDSQQTLINLDLYNKSRCTLTLSVMRCANKFQWIRRLDDRTDGWLKRKSVAHEIIQVMRMRTNANRYHNTQTHTHTHTLQIPSSCTGD